MFFNVRALLESSGIKIKGDLSIHSKTFDAFVYFYYLTGKLQKKLLEDYSYIKGESSEILGRQNANSLVEDYFFEKGKRAKFTYQMGTYAIKSKAKTSINRASRFSKEIRKMIKLQNNL